MQELTEWTWNSARAAGVLPKEWLNLHGGGPPRGRNSRRRTSTWANLRGANLTGANLTGANLTWADLTGANLTGANLTWANLRGANLTGANLTCADLTGAKLTEAKLTEADLRGANLTGANLAWANLTGANLDFSAWPLWCSSLNVKCGARLARQLAYHLCALGCDDPEFLQVREACLEFANKMHRADVPRLERKDT